MRTDARIAFLSRLADAAAAATLPHFRTELLTDSKALDDFDPVTAADREAELAMRALIRAEFPKDGIVGEEFGPENADAPTVWYLDPVDGTRSFIAGLPVWGTLIGYATGGLPAGGMMAQPFTGERFVGDGRSARYEGPGGARQIRTRTGRSLSEAVLFTTAPNLFRPREKTAFERVERGVRLSRYGTDCYAYCMLAAGLVDLVIEAGLKDHDIVALIPIIEGAGGRVTSWDGGPAEKGGRILAAGDARLHEAAMELLAAK